ncbi:DDB1- and CUL4-associated factor 15 isoform X1 [Lepisosteus oculatus]|uniref:DDB1- and CUL4-associated factor 15 isoform X1 n=1 Tax=Lepisosteus oculatus TaxID=7918 RepID=UPI0035F515EA
MAPSSKSERDDNKQKPAKKYKEHLVKLLNRGKLSGQLTHRLFRKLPPRVCVSLKTIVSEEFLRAGHIFLGFTKCGRYVLSYTSDCGEDDFSFYIYHLYWWEFNLHSRLRQVRQVRLFAGEEIYSDLYLTVCEWPSDRSKIVIFGFNTRSSSSVLMNLMMSDENNRDIYVTVATMPPSRPCTHCTGPPAASQSGSSQCLAHGYVLNSRYQVVYPFPTFQPAFQLKQDQVVLLNTSYSLVACAVSVCPAGDQGESSQILYRRRGLGSPLPSRPVVLPSPSPSSRAPGTPCSSPDQTQDPCKPQPPSPSPDQSQAAARAREFAADIFRRARGRNSSGEEAGGKRGDSRDALAEEETRAGRESPVPSSSSGGTRELSGSEEQASPVDRDPEGVGESHGSVSSSSSSTLSSSATEPGYVNYTRLQYCLQPPGAPEQDTEYEDDKVLLPFTVTDLRGRSLRLVKGQQPSQAQCVCVEQLTLDFEYVINEVIRNDAAWAPQFCSFSDYDIVILEVCPEMNTVVINIGLLLLAFPTPEEEHCRPNTYHSSLQVSWDLSTGVCRTVGVGELTEVKGQTSGSVWSSYRKSCVNTVMKWLVPESSSCYINRMTNEALHKGSSLKVLADSDRYTWIVL